MVSNKNFSGIRFLLPVKYPSMIILLYPLFSTVWYQRSWSTLVHVMSDLLPDGTKPLPEPVLSYHHWRFVTFTWQQFCGEHSRYQFIKGSLKITLVKLPSLLSGVNALWVKPSQNKVWISYTGKLPHGSCLSIVTLLSRPTDTIFEWGTVVSFVMVIYVVVWWYVPSWMITVT